MLIGTSPFFASSSQQLAALAIRHAVPAISPYREFPAAGGLMSYGGDSTDQYRLMGIYAGRILKGEKPSDLPVLGLSVLGFLLCALVFQVAFQFLDGLRRWDAACRHFAVRPLLSPIATQG